MYTTYDITTSAYEPSLTEREVALRRSLRAGYRMFCRRRPPPVTVRCDEAAQRCRFRVGSLGGVVGYDEALERMHC
jgi:hypothetical protein